MKGILLGICVICGALWLSADDDPYAIYDAEYDMWFKLDKPREDVDVNAGRIPKYICLSSLILLLILTIIERR